MTTLTIDERFKAFHANNPHVYELFKKYTHIAIATGVKRLSSKFIIERIRWDAMVSTVAKDFKINNDFTSRYARMFAAEFPAHADLFETRELLTA